MKKFILVEMPEDAGKGKIIWYGSPEIESTPPVLHGKRALLEECLKVGEFKGKYVIPKKDDVYIGTIMSSDLRVKVANKDFISNPYTVLTNLDEPSAITMEKRMWRIT